MSYYVAWFMDINVLLFITFTERSNVFFVCVWIFGFQVDFNNVTNVSFA